MRRARQSLTKNSHWFDNADCCNKDISASSNKMVWLLVCCGLGFFCCLRFCFACICASQLHKIEIAGLSL